MYDFVNSVFEYGGAFFILLHCRQVCLAKSSAGVSMPAVVFFALWGLWNVLYYPAIGQPLSFIAGVLVLLANCLWLFMIWKFRKTTITFKR